MNTYTIYHKLFGGNYPKTDDVKTEIRNAGNDLGLAQTALIQRGREHLDSCTSAYIYQETASLRARAVSLRISDRVQALEDRSTEIEALASALSEDILVAELQRAEASHAFYAVYAGDQFSGDFHDPLESAAEVVRLRVQQALAADVSLSLQKVAHGIDALRQESIADLRAYEDVKCRLTTLLNEERIITANAILAPQQDWVTNADILDAFATRAIAAAVRLPIGELAIQDPAVVVEHILEDVLSLVEAPPSLAALPKATLASFLNAMEPNHGVSEADRILWDVPRPWAMVYAPPNAIIPQDCPTGCQSERLDGDENTLLTRVFQWLPLPTVPGFYDGLTADERIRSIHGGLVATSAEVDPDAIHFPILRNFDSVRAPWALSPNGADDAQGNGFGDVETEYSIPITRGDGNGHTTQEAVAVSDI